LCQQVILWRSSHCAIVRRVWEQGRHVVVESNVRDVGGCGVAGGACHRATNPGSLGEPPLGILALGKFKFIESSDQLVNDFAVFNLLLYQTTHGLRRASTLFMVLDDPALVDHLAAPSMPLAWGGLLRTILCPMFYEAVAHNLFLAFRALGHGTFAIEVVVCAQFHEGYRFMTEFADSVLVEAPIFHRRVPSWGKPGAGRIRASDLSVLATTLIVALEVLTGALVVTPFVWASDLEAIQLLLDN
jgi:hypothetical protein